MVGKRIGSEAMMVLAVTLGIAVWNPPATAQAPVAPVSASVAAPVSPTAPAPDGDQVLLGAIVQTTGKTPQFRSGGKTYHLTARSDYILKTLADKRIADRRFRLEGKAQPDGSFEIDRFYTIHDGKLFKVRFYCDTCHITYVEPGRCVCCQGETELKEVPASDTDE